MPNKTIARKLVLSEATVHSCISEIYAAFFWGGGITIEASSPSLCHKGRILAVKWTSSRTAVEDTFRYVAGFAHYRKQIVFEMLTAIRVVAEIHGDTSQRI